MKLSDFKYTLPKPSVARYPVKPRDSAKMMVFQRGTTNVEHKNLPTLWILCQRAMFLL